MMDGAAAAKLREPFAPEQVGKLPKPTAKENKKGRCRECGGWHGLPAVHLDYVGHAAVTDRLLQVDPCWTWEPMGRDDDGAPVLDEHGGLWISLTIAGVTRPGYGHADGKRGGNAVKEAIGDAIRNAAMRFGVALDLWTKEDLHAFKPDTVERIASEDARRLADVLNRGGKEARDAWLDRFGCKPADLPADRLSEAEDFVSDLVVEVGE